MKYLIIIILLITAIIPLKAQDLTSARSAFEQANAAFTEGKFEEALLSYKQITAEYHTFAYYYNLGNVYYKLDSLAPCILAYERAKMIKTNDENLEFNIELANQRVIDKIEALPTLGVKDFWTNITAKDNLQKWTNSSIILFVLAFGLLILMLFNKSAILRRLLILGSAFCFFAFILSYYMASSIESEHSNKDAIIFVDKIEVKSVPGAQGVDVFILHEGTKVNIRDDEGEWYEIRIASGNVGWLPKSSVVTI